MVGNAYPVAIAPGTDRVPTRTLARGSEIDLRVFQASCYESSGHLHCLDVSCFSFSTAPLF